MSKDILSALEEQFNQECLAINVKEEYPDYLGTEQWIIITDLSDKELTARYEDLINRYYPYIKLSVEQGKAIIIYRRNEDKHRKRKKLYESFLPDCDGFCSDKIRGRPMVAPTVWIIQVFLQSTAQVQIV